MECPNDSDQEYVKTDYTRIIFTLYLFQSNIVLRCRLLLWRMMFIRLTKAFESGIDSEEVMFTLQ